MKFLRLYLLPWLMYLVGALVFTWPAALNLGSKVINTRSGDVWQHLWNQWWMPYSLFELKSQPYHTNLLFYPDGANLYFHALNPLTGYLGMPLQALFGLTASFVMVQFLQITFAAFGAYLLARYLSGHTGGALVAGVIYGFCPLQAELMNLGQLELTSIEWLPYFVLFFLKTMRGDARPWLNRACAGLFLLALSFTTWYYTLYGLIFAGLYLLWQLVATYKVWRKAWPVLLRRFTSFFLIWLIPVAPVLFLTVRDAAGGGTQASQSLFIIVYNSADLAGFLRPGQSAIWGWFGAQSGADIRGQFLGFATLALAIAGLITGWKNTRFWLYITLAFFVLALGPVFHFNFDPNWSDADGRALEGLPLPGRILNALPLGNILRVPLRATLVMMLSFGIMAAYAIRRFDEWQKGPKAGLNWQRVAVPVIAGTLVFLEFLPAPRVLASADIPQFYKQLGQSSDKLAVLELPDSVNAKAMYYQTAHHHPLAGGYISRKPASYQLLDTTGFNREMGSDTPRNDIFGWPRAENLPSSLYAAGIGWVVVHPREYSPTDWPEASGKLSQIFSNTKPYYQDNEILVYQINPPAEDKTDPAKIYPYLGDGWSGRVLSGTEVSRTVSKDATLTLTSPYKTTFKATLVIRVQSLEKPRTLKISANNRELLTKSIPVNATEIEVPLDLAFGPNILTLAVEGGDGVRPALSFGAFSLK